MTNKVAYHILALEVDKLYPPYYQLKPNETVEDHVQYIADFIRSCGWDESEYIERWLRDGSNIN